MAKKTVLYDEHVNLGAKIVEFAGYLMPIQYAGIMQEHRRVRTTVGIFDVSHMGEFLFSGSGAEDFLQKMTVNNVKKLTVGQVQYSVLCYDDGGIVDDLLLYRYDDHFMMVVNASNLQKDWDWLAEHKPAGVNMKNISDATTLLAVQGPKSRELLQKLTDTDLSVIKFYHFTHGAVNGAQMTISRTGYTGELGFELYMDNQYGVKLWQTILSTGKGYEIEPVGLGARDTLRLEMKYCLYGNDIDQTTNPLEAGLGWITKLKKGDFIGRDVLLKVKEEELKRKLIGFQMNSRAFPRHEYPIFKNGREIGMVTSGTFSPMLNAGIGIGYVETRFADVGATFGVKIRKNLETATVVETPFYKPDN
ncbi:MAG TPA: glycine cleavage system aminomethyltransferase GcvT [Bacteroidetes bacterium]|nr:glycine cleavage system aminomethyltransferase GcvT [Bacteroidota bacterium]